MLLTNSGRSSGLMGGSRVGCWEGEYIVMQWWETRKMHVIIGAKLVLANFTNVNAKKLLHVVSPVVRQVWRYNTANTALHWQNEWQHCLTLLLVIITHLCYSQFDLHCIHVCTIWIYSKYKYSTLQMATHLTIKIFPSCMQWTSSLSSSAHKTRNTHM